MRVLLTMTLTGSELGLLSKSNISMENLAFI